MSSYHYIICVCGNGFLQQSSSQTVCPDCAGDKKRKPAPKQHFDTPLFCWRCRDDTPHRRVGIYSGVLFYACVCGSWRKVAESETVD